MQGVAVGNQTETPASRKGRRPSQRATSWRAQVHSTARYRAWFEEFMQHTGEVDISDLFREAVRRYAAEAGFRPPPKR